MRGSESADPLTCQDSEADRVVAEQVIATLPEIRLSVRAQRAFLGRAVHFLAAEAGIRQFLDIGTGLPSANNTHEVAQRAAPESRVVYVDNDPIALLHARSLLTSLPEGSHAEVTRFFAGLDLIEPGLVQLHRWRAGIGAPGRDLPNYAAVAANPPDIYLRTEILVSEVNIF